MSMDPDRIPTKDGYIYVGDGKGFFGFMETGPWVLRVIVVVAGLVALTAAWMVPLMILTNWMSPMTAVWVEVVVICVAIGAYKLGAARADRRG